MTREEAATQRIETLEARLAGKEHHHVTGEFCVACGIEEGKRVDLLETANKRVGSILLRGLLLANRAGLDVIDKYIAASALGLLMQGRLSSEVSPETKAEVAFEKLIKDHDVEIAQLRARVEQLVKVAPPAAQVERWKKLEEAAQALLTKIVEHQQGSLNGDDGPEEGFSICSACGNSAGYDEQPNHNATDECGKLAVLLGLPVFTPAPKCTACGGYGDDSDGIPFGPNKTCEACGGSGNAPLPPATPEAAPSAEEVPS